MVVLSAESILEEELDVRSEDVLSVDRAASMLEEELLKLSDEV